MVADLGNFVLRAQWLTSQSNWCGSAPGGQFEQLCLEPLVDNFGKLVWDSSLVASIGGLACECPFGGLFW